MPDKKQNNKQKEEENNNKLKNRSAAIVGIGASAGGIEAFISLLKNLPDNTGMAYVFIQHLEPTHESKLSEIFSKHTSMNVVQAKNRMPVSANQIYTIPPDKYISLKNNKLILSERKKQDGIFMPIDYFFQSLAAEGKNKTVGIILSGTASDGMLGLKAIKAEGGLTFAQDEKSAKYFGMPNSAIDSGNVDIVLPPEGIAKELIRIGNHPYIAFSQPKEKEIENEDEDSLSKIFRKLRTSTGVDFSHYKLNTIKRRVSRRMVVNKIDTIENYANFVKENKNEVNYLYQDLLINVTNFFRDQEVFDALKKKVYSEITKNVKPDNSLRIWVPGCSTGEEVYSIAISLLEYFDKKTSNYNVQIFATDISEPSIEKARTGIYSGSSIEGMPHEIIKKYFIKINGGYQISKAVRDLCVFARQDIAKDPPFSRIDLISCRNLLIYLSPELQKKIIPIFHYALNSKGYLLLGTSESIGRFADLFFLIDKKHKIYEKKQIGNRLDFNFSFSNFQYEKTKVKEYNNITSNIDVQKEADKVILNRFAPPGVLVNNNFEIVQIRGKINKYIEPSPGDASLNLFKMMKEGLSLELHSSLRKAKTSSTPVVIEDIYLYTNGDKHSLDLEVIPIKHEDNPNEFYYLILFKEKEKTRAVEKKEKVIPPATKLKKWKENEKEIIIGKLKEELLITKEHLQSIIEEREATNEELRSAIEELQSSNEELQSTNEEMETTREELQSTNEELITVNDELESRNVDLNEINNDLNNLLFSVHIPIIMLGSDLKIRRYTPKAEKIWNLIASDVGRPISNITSNIHVDNLKEIITDVIDHLETRELQAKDDSGNWYSMNIRPYRTVEGKIDGVVISLVDVDTMKKDFDKALKGKNFSEAVFNTVVEPLIVLYSDLRIKAVNKSFYQIFNFKREDVADVNIYDLGKGEWNNPSFRKFIDKVLKDSFTKEYKVQLLAAGRTSKVLILNAQKFTDNGDEYILIAIKEN